MLFNEIYGSYFKIVSEIIELAVDGKIDSSGITKIIQEKGFQESSLSIPDKIKSQEWPIIDADGNTPIANYPEIPLTIIQKRWLKALLSDPRIKLFDIDASGLEDVEPLYNYGDIVYFDQYSDGDNYTDDQYIRNFKTILSAIKNKESISVVFKSKRDIVHKWTCKPEKIEYSLKDDKFRIHVEGNKRSNTINLNSIIDCYIVDYDSQLPVHSEPDIHTVVLEILDERNTLERAMLHFSHFQKETVNIDNDRYRMTLMYDQRDETELLIRILSFGPTIRVIEPDSFIELIQQRLSMQRQL